MDQFDHTIYRIATATESGALEWDNASPVRFEQIVTNPARIIRAFTAQWKLADKVFSLLLVEKKSEHYDDFDNLFERLSFELFVIDVENTPILHIYEGLVDREDLVRLASIVASTSRRTIDFFNLLDATDPENS